MSVATLMLYGVTWLFVALTPGPAVMCVASQAARYGWRAACLGVLGVQVGSIALFVCLARGLSALLATATNALTILQFAGAGYLLYFGARIFCSSFRASSKDQLQSPGLPSCRRRLVLQALVIQVTNPKALLFVSALVPQFLDPNEHLPLQFATLLVCTVVVDAFVLGSYAFLVERGVQSFRSRRISRWIERAFGAGLVGFIKLLVWRRRALHCAQKNGLAIFSISSVPGECTIPAGAAANGLRAGEKLSGELPAIRDAEDERRWEIGLETGGILGVRIRTTIFVPQLLSVAWQPFPQWRIGAVRIRGQILATFPGEAIVQGPEFSGSTSPNSDVSGMHSSLQAPSSTLWLATNAEGLFRYLL